MNRSDAFAHCARCAPRASKPTCLAEVLQVFEKPVATRKTRLVPKRVHDWVARTSRSSRNRSRARVGSPPTYGIDLSTHDFHLRMDRGHCSVFVRILRNCARVRARCVRTQVGHELGWCHTRTAAGSVSCWRWRRCCKHSRRPRTDRREPRLRRSITGKTRAQARFPGITRNCARCARDAFSGGRRCQFTRPSIPTTAVIGPHPDKATESRNGRDCHRPLMVGKHRWNLCAQRPTQPARSNRDKVQIAIPSFAPPDVDALTPICAPSASSRLTLGPDNALRAHVRPDRDIEVTRIQLLGARHILDQ